MLRVYKKTSAAVCGRPGRPGGPGRWTISSIVSWLALPQPDTETTDQGPTASSQRTDVSVGAQPRLLRFNFMFHSAAVKS